MGDITVSVIIPVFNSEKYIEECIESVYVQSFTNYELIVVDDGSTDNSINVINSIKCKHPNMQVINKKNGGPGSARNVGLKASRGEYIYYLDSDDVLESNMLEICISKMKEHNTDLLVFQARIFGEIKGKDTNQYIYSGWCEDINKTITGDVFIEKYYRKIPLLNTPMMVARREFLISSNLFYKENTYYEDLEYYYRLMSYSPTIILIDSILYNRRYRPNSIMTSTLDSKRIYDNINIYIDICMLKVNKKLKDIYIGVSIKEICRYLNLLDDLSCHIQEKDVFITECFNRISRDNSGVSFLTLCELYSANKRITNNSFTSECQATVLSIMKLFLKRTMSGFTGSTIGAYGSGYVADLFFSIYDDILKKENWQFDIIYIDTFAETGSSTYRGKKITNYKDVDYNQLSSVLVLSELYNDEIVKNIREKNKEVKIVLITDIVD